MPSTLSLTLLVDCRTQETIALKQIETLLSHSQLRCDRILLLTAAAITSPEAMYRNVPVQVVTVAEALAYLDGSSSAIVGFIPQAAYPDTPLLELPSENFLAPWLPRPPEPMATAAEACLPAVAWLASTPLACIALDQLATPDRWTLLAVAAVLETAGIPFQWATLGCNSSSRVKDSPQPSRTVLALIPHYRCEAWLHRCLRSLIHQTRPLDGIVVIDDGSERPPIEIVQQFPDVTLLASATNVGPYRLVHQVIADTHYWAYLFQDADDWSMGDRLELLLQAAVSTGADLVGTQEIRVYEETAQLSVVGYPLDVNAALEEKPGHPLLHPTSLVTRDLVLRVGGFATGLRFGGDTEFLLRAALTAKAVNIPHYGYVRRKRSDSLTTAPSTGLDSPARQALLQRLKQRALENRSAINAGEPPILTPLVTADPISLTHLIGPELN